MLAENLPRCVCRKHNYIGGGGYIGPNLSYTNFKCNSCQRYVIELYPWIFFSSEKEHGNTLMDYINKVILPLRRQMKEEDIHLHPPQIPQDVDIYERVEAGYIIFDHKICQNFPLPVDPIVTKHRELWGPVVEAMQAKEIPNKYYKDINNKEPWYEFNYHDATIRFGPRKRVYSIQVGHPTKFNVVEISKLAEKDGTSFWIDDSWHQFNADQASSMEIHAWGKEKFDIYLDMIMNGIKPG